jgi:Zn-dependent alcohol dehydrogenase
MYKSLAAIHFKKNQDLTLDEISFSSPNFDEVVLKNNFAGICHSQLINLSRTPECPELLGHEGTAEVVAVGNKVKHVKEGDKVIISWMPNHFSKTRNYLKWTSFNYRNNNYKSLIYNWSTYSKINSQFVSKLNKNANLKTYSIMGCAVISGYLAAEKIVDKKNFNSLVLGAGGLGLLAINALKNLKVKNNIVLDKSKEKLLFAKKMGCTHLINNTTENVEEKIMYITKNEGLDYIFDFTGNQSLQESCFKILKKGIPGYSVGGTLAIIGFSYDNISFSAKNLLMNNQTIIGMRGGQCDSEKDFPNLINKIKNNTIKIKKVITEEHELKDINGVIKKFKNNKILGRAIIKI